MLQLLDGSQLSGEEVVFAESLYGLDVEEKYNIFKKHLPEEEFIDRRIHKSELVEAETDSEDENNNLVDEYDEDGRKTISNSKNSRFNNSKRSNFSKNSKNSKRSSFSKSWPFLIYSVLIDRINRSLILNRLSINLNLLD